MHDIALDSIATTVPRPVLCLGDSHVTYIVRAQKHFLLAPRQVSSAEVGGATAVGFRNPNSMTDALGHYRKALKGRAVDGVIVLQLGEVDCGYVIWYRAEKYGDAIEVQMEHSVGAYFSFVDELLGLGWRHVIITGATLPTITDTDQQGEVVRKRSGIKATQRQRTELTLRYNERLREEAVARGLHYVEVTHDVLDPATGYVAKRFRNRDPWDHHMRYELAAVEWARRLTPVLEAIDPLPASWGWWRATRDTFVKAYVAHSKDMPAEMRLAVPEGAVLRARLNAAGSEMLTLSEAMLDGTRLDERLRLIHKAHFTQLGG